MFFLTRKVSDDELRIELAGLEEKLKFLTDAKEKNWDVHGFYSLDDDMQRIGELKKSLELRGVKP